MPDENKIINLKNKMKLETPENYVWNELNLKKFHKHILLVRTTIIVFYYNCCPFNRKEKVEKALQQYVLDWLIDWWWKWKIHATKYNFEICRKNKCIECLLTAYC